MQLAGIVVTATPDFDWRVVGAGFGRSVVYASALYRAALRHGWAHAGVTGLIARATVPDPYLSILAGTMPEGAGRPWNDVAICSRAMAGA